MRTHQQEYVLATGKTNTVRQFIDKTLAHLSIPGYWEGDECFDKRNDKLIVTTDKSNLRPVEVGLLVGDPTKAKTELGWNHKHDVDSLIVDMVEEIFMRINCQVITITKHPGESLIRQGSDLCREDHFSP